MGEPIRLKLIIYVSQMLVPQNDPFLAFSSFNIGTQDSFFIKKWFF